MSKIVRKASQMSAVKRVGKPMSKPVVKINRPKPQQIKELERLREEEATLDTGFSLDATKLG